MNYIIELINKIGDAIPCQLILQFVDKDWESVLGVLIICVLLFLLDLSETNMNNPFFIGKVMAKSVEKPFSIIGLLAVSGGDKKKTLPTNKPKPFNKGRSSTVETHYKSTHDLLPPHKRKMVVNIEDNVEPAGSSLVNFSNFGGPLIWMSLSQEIDHVILSKDWESIQKKGLADLESTMSILAGVKEYLIHFTSG